MNGFNSKVVCKNSSVTIWKILFNIAIPIIHHKWGGVSHNKGGLIITHLSLWYAPRAYHNDKCVMINPPGAYHNGGLMKTLHRPNEGHVISLADPRGRQGRMRPGSKFFHFHAVFGKSTLAQPLLKKILDPPLNIFKIKFSQGNKKINQCPLS